MAVSMIVSPFVKELEDGANVCTSADSLFAASSKLFFVLVLASKNKDVTKVPCKAGIFFVPAFFSDLIFWPIQIQICNLELKN